MSFKLLHGSKDVYLLFGFGQVAEYLGNSVSCVAKRYQAGRLRHYRRPSRKEIVFRSDWVHVDMGGAK